MDRREQITKYLSKEQKGIEIGPWFNPLVPKRDGYNAVVMDVFETQKLREIADGDRYVPKGSAEKIEDVDIIGSCARFGELVLGQYPAGTFDYVVSSHNFEHLPNPIQFLQDCQQVLKPGGMLSMAIPDKRTCFDYFRPHSLLADLLEAWFEKRTRPTAKQVFVQGGLHCRYRLTDDSDTTSFNLSEDPAGIIPQETLEDAFSAWQTFNTSPDEVYRDTHCWTFTPSSFWLIMQDLAFLGLCRMQLIDLSQANGNEFYAHLRNVPEGEWAPISKEAHYALRRQLLHQIQAENAFNVAPYAYAGPSPV